MAHLGRVKKEGEKGRRGEGEKGNERDAPFLPFSPSPLLPLLSSLHIAGVVAAAMAHCKLISSLHSYAKRSKAAIGERVRRIVADHVNVTKFVRDPTSQTTEIAYLLGIIHRAAAGRR